MHPCRSFLLCFVLALNGVFTSARFAFCSPFESLEGRVLCGYQGWFRAEGDSSNLGWVHFGPGKKFGPGLCTFDLWPDLSEFGAHERFPSPFRFADGSTAALFSSVHPDTVRRHFRWMREYGIDGALLQRFGTEIVSERLKEAVDVVMGHCVDAAVAEGRSLAVMYDLTGMFPEQFPRIAEDWRSIVSRGWASRACAQFHNGKPLVALYGLGFANQPAALAEWRELLVGIQKTGASILLGIPTFWREGKRDALPDTSFHELLREVDVLSPWTVGRMARSPDVESIAENVWKKDIAWCREAGKAYLPVIFPGFSWHNLSKVRGRDARVDAIPREGGRFLWKQAVEATKAGAQALYVAMFDEIDEGTAIMKCAAQRPVGESPFVDVSDVPSDHYLWLSGEAGRLLRKEIPLADAFPKR